ncbi:MAG: TetR family transcriptional regulator [Candidatus Binatia bacterium]|nr:MAG: TetR family transcriptional regulator [Candidatus Binatia bacterium]
MRLAAKASSQYGPARELMGSESSGSSALSHRFRARRERTRSQLLDAAKKVLSQKGYHRTRVLDIARAARVAVGTVYLYYPTKEKLFLELVDDVVQKLRERIEDVQARVRDPVELVKARHRTFFRFAKEHRELFRIVFGTDPFHDVVRRAQQLFIADVAHNLEEGMRLGVFRAKNPELLAHAMVGLAVQSVHWWVEQEVPPPMEEVSEEILDFLLLGLQGVSPEEARKNPG